MHRRRRVVLEHRQHAGSVAAANLEDVNARGFEQRKLLQQPAALLEEGYRRVCMPLKVLVPAVDLPLRASSSRGGDGSLRRCLSLLNLQQRLSTRSELLPVEVA